MTLKELRESLGLTQEQAGERLGFGPFERVTKQRFGQLEKAWPRIEPLMILRIAKAFGVGVRGTDRLDSFEYFKRDDLTQEESIQSVDPD